MMQIAVIGSDGKVPKDVEEAAEQIGADIAKNNCVLVCGGRGGVMEAACRGAKAENGLTVGILPSSDKEGANPHLDVVIPTGMSYARNSLVVSCGDVVIAVHGGVGTLSEIALAMNYGKPVIAVIGTGGISDSIESEFDHHGQKVKIHRAKAEAAVELAMSLAQHDE